jgi:hypothetical protein
MAMIIEYFRNIRRLVIIKGEEWLKMRQKRQSGICVLNSVRGP